MHGVEPPLTTSRNSDRTPSPANRCTVFDSWVPELHDASLASLTAFMANTVSSTSRIDSRSCLSARPTTFASATQSQGPSCCAI